MARFQFRLETLLKLRMADRRQRRQELATAYQAEKMLGEQTQNLAQEELQIRRRTQLEVSPGEVNVDNLLTAQRYAAVLKARARLLDQQREKLQHEMDRRRQALVEADRQVRVLEKLRERQREEHAAHEARIEVKDLDEVAQRSANGRAE
jgi:flagellar FliJ protein